MGRSGRDFSPLRISPSAPFVLLYYIFPRAHHLTFRPLPTLNQPPPVQTPVYGDKFPGTRNKTSLDLDLHHQLLDKEFKPTCCFQAQIVSHLDSDIPQSRSQPEHISRRTPNLCLESLRPNSRGARGTSTTMVKPNDAIAIIVIILFVVLALVAFAIYRLVHTARDGMKKTTLPIRLGYAPTLSRTQSPKRGSPMYDYGSRQHGMVFMSISSDDTQPTAHRWLLGIKGARILTDIMGVSIIYDCAFRYHLSSRTFIMTL
ncbi:hypothetical protein SODALDRAFT_380921 [Sodiomyces alkalinus F11]|uniref:Uncharacterized protein n=1 Tax=Sodiomyces alkalinus (strain CBS 110278 / VKM F-3762 / F11) TaxID=1314773 RepID=A0A3N2PQ68_SODAK|nr:hypothetical protein SODALDRAFT_380921 [Sodiomyces alkalinus F11]ROT36618.1 hypothetical protein SODALDRAFT_380921 [Sodiomyces alkalinus F11]